MSLWKSKRFANVCSIKLLNYLFSQILSGLIWRRIDLPSLLNRKMVVMMFILKNLSSSIYKFKEKKIEIILLSFLMLFIGITWSHYFSQNISPVFKYFTIAVLYLSALGTARNIRIMINIIRSLKIFDKIRNER